MASSIKVNLEFDACDAVISVIESQIEIAQLLVNNAQRQLDAEKVKLLHWHRALADAKAKKFARESN